MSDYISREAARKNLCDFCIGHDICDHKGNCNAMTAFDSIPAADVRENKRGKWIPRDRTWGRSFYSCSCCELTVDMPTEMGKPMFIFCPNCGAEMWPSAEELTQGHLHLGYVEEEQA